MAEPRQTYDICPITYLDDLFAIQALVTESYDVLVMRHHRGHALFHQWQHAAQGIVANQVMMEQRSGSM